MARCREAAALGEAPALGTKLRYRKVAAWGTGVQARRGGGSSTPPGLEGLISQTGEQKFFLLPPGYGGSIQQKINVPAWPNVAQIAQWLIQLGKNLVAVSPHSDLAEVEWINECKYKTLEELADSGEKRFFKMDLKLSAELHAAYKNEKDAVRLMEEVQIMEEYCASKGVMLKGGSM